LNSDTPEKIFITLIELRHSGDIYFDPNSSDTTEWERDTKKEDITKNARRAMAEAEAIAEIVKIHVFRETTPLRGDIMLHPLPLRSTLQLSFFVCLS